MIVFPQMQSFLAHTVVNLLKTKQLSVGFVTFDKWCV